MEREVLLTRLVALLRSTLQEHRVEGSFSVTPEAPLVGPEAVMTSLVFVQFVSDVEVVLSEEHGLEVLLVSEQALSRRNSPFRTLATLADYILELTPLPA